MNRPILILVAIAANMLLVVGAHAEQAYYVQSSKAKILAAPTFSARVVDEVTLGQMLTMKGKQGSWIKVERNGQVGFVSALLLATRPPLNRVKFIQADATEIKQGVRRRTSSFSSAAAARGLTKDDRKRADVDDNINYKAVYKMEALTISDSEVAQFAAGEKP